VKTYVVTNYASINFYFLEAQTKSYKIMKTKMFAILDKAKPNTGNTKGLNLAEVMFANVHVFRLPLWPELLVSSKA
jgi:hypothetical protein